MSLQFNFFIFYFRKSISGLYCDMADFLAMTKEEMEEKKYRVK